MYAFNLNTTTFIGLLNSLLPFFSIIKIPAFQNLLASFLNVIEKVVAESKEDKDIIQKQSDEINRLKGEQGKPKINPKKKNNDISSEKERLQAELPAQNDPNQEMFKLGAATLGKLQETGLPAELLETLKKISHLKFTDELSFFKAIELEIGTPLSGDHRKLLHKHARYLKRNSVEKISQIHIDRHEKCLVDKSLLPDDAVYKGFENKVVQELKIKTDNICFEREVFYSASQKQTYRGGVPIGFEGNYGPEINGLILSMKYVSGVSNPKIKEFLNNAGIIISQSTVTAKLIKPPLIAVFQKETDDLFKAVLESFEIMQIDDTGTRIDGENFYAQILCNEYYTLFFTTKHKDRLTILDILRGFRPREYLLDSRTIPFLEKLGVSKPNILLLNKYMKETLYSEDNFLEVLKKVFGEKTPRIQKRILEASAICCYHEETGFDVLKILLCDDAPQFKWLTFLLALCWVHNGRHYKKLMPIISFHREMLDLFLARFWEYYRKLHLYKKMPTPEQAKILSEEFDNLFSTITGYEELDARIAKTKIQKAELLVVLDYPETPLTNNNSEHEARRQKRYQDISFQTKTMEGTKAKDTLMSVVATCIKLGINPCKFIYDRISKKFDMPTLANMIRAKANLLNTSF